MEEAKTSAKIQMAILPICCIVLGALGLFLANTLGGVEINQMLLFMLAQFAFVLVPGMALALYINPPKEQAALFILSYLLGIAIVVAEYFLFYAIGLKEQLWIGMAVVSVLSVYLIYRKKSTVKKLYIGKNTHPAGFALLAALLMVALLTAVSNYNIPGVGQRTFIYQDLAWNTGNVASIAQAFPVKDIHIEGFSFGYHFFASVFLAVFQNILGLSAYVLNIKFFAIVQVFVLSGGLYLLFSGLFKNKWLAAGAAMAALLCSSLVMEHFMWYAYATPMGLGFALVATHYFLRYMRVMDTAKVWNRDFILFLILLAMAAGIKSLMAAGVIAGAGIVIIAQLFRRKNVKHLLAAGVLTLAVFVGLYVVMVYGTHAFNGLQRTFAATMYAETPLQPAYYTALREALPMMPVTAVKLMAYPLFMLLNYPVVAISLVLLLVAMIRSRKHRADGLDWPYGSGIVKLFLFSAVFISMLAMSVVSQPGESQVLFLEGSVPLAAFTLFYLAAEARKSKDLWGKAGRIVLYGVVAMALVWNIGITAKTLYTNSKGQPSWNNSQELLAGQPYNTISREEYDGMMWLKHNTPEDAVFASDRQYYVPNPVLSEARYYYYTAFSERQCYLEGYNYVSTHEANFKQIIEERLALLDAVYQNDAAAVNKLVQDGVQYLVISTLWHPEFILNETFGKVVFENSDITIYKLHV